MLGGIHSITSGHDISKAQERRQRPESRAPNHNAQLNDTAAHVGINDASAAAHMTKHSRTIAKLCTTARNRSLNGRFGFQEPWGPPEAEASVTTLVVGVIRNMSVEMRKMFGGHPQHNQLP